MPFLSKSGLLKNVTLLVFAFPDSAISIKIGAVEECHSSCFCSSSLSCDIKMKTRGGLSHLLILLACWCSLVSAQAFPSMNEMASALKKLVNDFNSRALEALSLAKDFLRSFEELVPRAARIMDSINVACDVVIIALFLICLVFTHNLRLHYTGNDFISGFAYIILVF